MRHFSKTSIQFIAGFTAAFMVSALPLSAAIAPLRAVIVSPIQQQEIEVPKPDMAFEIQTLQIRGQLDLERLSRLEAQFGSQIIETGKYIPTSLDAGDSEAKIALKILEQSAETWMADSELSRTITSVQNGLTASVDEKDSVKFRIKPLTGETQIVHQGTVETSLGYHVSDHDVTLKVTWSF